MAVLLPLHIHLASERNVDLKIMDDLSHADYLFKLISNTFDPYTGDILGKDEVIARIKDGKVLAVYEEGRPVACLEFYLKGKVAWIGHIVVDQEKRGRGYGTLLVKSYIKMLFENGIRRFQHWVIASNVRAIEMYTKLGFAYGNKSSFSMLKSNRSTGM